MSVTVPQELEDQVREQAARRQVPVEQVLRDALNWYFKMDPDLLDELAAWEEIRDEAFDLIEDASS
ncbi:MAG: hypothetical protein ACREJB_11905 [Planctomycetaceae bacterium]